MNGKGEREHRRFEGSEINSVKLFLGKCMSFIRCMSQHLWQKMIIIIKCNVLVLYLYLCV